MILNGLPVISQMTALFKISSSVSDSRSAVAIKCVQAGTVTAYSVSIRVNPLLSASSFVNG